MLFWVYRGILNTTGRHTGVYKYFSDHDDYPSSEPGVVGSNPPRRTTSSIPIRMRLPFWGPFRVPMGRIDSSFDSNPALIRLSRLPQHVQPGAAIWQQQRIVSVLRRRAGTRFDFPHGDAVNLVSVVCGFLETFASILKVARPAGTKQAHDSRLLVVGRHLPVW